MEAIDAHVGQWPRWNAEICAAAYLCFEKLRAHEPMLWEDYAVETVREDGLPTVQTPYRKV